MCHPILRILLLLAWFSLTPASLGATVEVAPPVTDLEATVRAFAALGDRSTGTPGNARAAEMVAQVFNDLAQEVEGAVVGRHSFRVPVYRHEQSLLRLEESGREVAMSSLLLNALSSGAVPEPGVEGPLIYVGQGRLEDFNGHEVQDAVVLMDMDSGKNWQNAPLLGARALIFLDEDGRGAASRGMFEQKLELTPIDFPRFWMQRSEAEALFGDLGDLAETRQHPRVSLGSRIAWHNAVTENVYCFIPGAGEERGQELLILEAFYDSTAFVADKSPGADEASSIAALLELARFFKDNPPARAVLLLASSGHAQDVAGVREFVWMLTTEAEELDKLLAEQRTRMLQARQTIELLEWGELLDQAHELGEEDAALVRQAFASVIKVELEELNGELIRLRLQAEPDQARIRKLADRRQELRHLVWVRSSRVGELLNPKEKDILAVLLPAARKEQENIHQDAREQVASLESGLELRDLIEDKPLAAMASLHLSSHGEGIGPFEKGWLYDLYDSLNRTRFFTPIDELLRGAATELPEDVGGRFQDTLRPSKLRNWQSYLPDRPLLGGEPAALAGLPGFTLTTVQDSRATWGTPVDVPERMDFVRLEREYALLEHLTLALAERPLPDVGKRDRDHFSTLHGRANLLRHGELFPDKPAWNTVALTYQGASRFYAMADTSGKFRVPGLMNTKATVHKAVIEAFRFDEGDGRAFWAVDKPETGKDNYRVKIRRAVMETDLVMFPCVQSTMFNTFEPRTFRYLIYVTLLDGRTEAEPRRYWYSRLDTWSSTLFTVFTEPGVPMKLTLSDTLLERKMLLLNASEKDPEGRGFMIKDWPVIPATEYQAAADMWHLLEPRIATLEERGIVNKRLWDLARRGQDILAQAERSRDGKDWAGFVESSRESLAIAGQVYNEVEKTQKDVLAGVLFYVALFVPFAYCLERLVFAFTSIHKRIVAFSSFLLLIIAIIYVVHPAFQLTYSPMVVILAFFILGLAVLVATIIFLRFEREMQALQQRSRHVKLTSMSMAAAFGAAFVLGVSNLRRRPVRTALTCITLVILTFTIMNFTSVKSVRQSGWSSFSDQASYHGLFMKAFNWKDLPPEALQVVSTMVGEQGVVAPRIWFEIKDKTRSPVVPIEFGGKERQARGVVGLSADEPRVTGLDQALVAGEWFQPKARNEIIIPRGMAEFLGVEPGQEVMLWGRKLRVSGIIADNALEERPDLDGEAMTPIIYPSEADTSLGDVEAEAIAEGEDVVSYQSRYQHIPADQVVIVPAETLLALGGSGGWLAGGGRLKGMALKLAPEEERSLTQEELGARFGLLLFRGADDGTSVYYAADAFRYSGMANIVIPLLISALIVLNTMIGSVYERKGEIAVYTSVGLAPSHVSFLFVAETLAFGVLSVVAGYLLAQAAAVVLAGTPLWAGMTANYSSMAGVGAMLLVLGVTLLSAIYPSRVAANIAIPDVNRSWTMPAAKGDLIDTTLPFLIKVSEQACAGGFLADYYEGHRDVSHGLFSTDTLACGYLPEDEAGLENPPQARPPEADFSADSCLTMGMRVWLAPFDFGVRQRVELIFCPSDLYQGFRQIKLRLYREAGERTVWHNLNRAFINDLRKQLLTWRSLDEEARERYEREFMDMYRGAPAAFLQEGEAQ
jgi:hypothetical protein